MERLLSFATRWPRTVLCVFVLLSAAALVGTTRLKNEGDLLVFLPTNDADVRLFKDVSRRFGALHVALIGMETTPGDDVFSTRSVERLQAATDAIRNVRGVDRVVSLTSLSDVVAGPSGAEVTQLVAAPPRDATAHAQLRDKVMAREHVVGQFVSRDGRATLIMVFLADGAEELRVEERVREAVGRELGGFTTYFGGAPYAAKAIYEETQADVWRLSPVALSVLLLVVVLSFRDLVGMLLTVLSVAWAALIVLGGMGWYGERFTVATSTLPVILFASGSSYAVHVLGRYYLLREHKGNLDAMREALRIVGPPLLIAAGTTAVGFYSFVTTDVRPMRAFGIACGSGVLLCWLTSLTLVPAVITLWPRRAQGHLKLDRMGEALVDLWRWARRRRLVVVAGALVIGALTVGPMTRVSVRMEPRAFFRVGSEPWRAERFLEERFGGATFVQVALSGDLGDPATLREVGRLEDFARALPGVSQVTSVVEPLELVNDVMGGGRHLPATRGQAGNLYFFLEGEAGMRALLAADRKEALVQIRLRGATEPVIDALEGYVAKTLRRAPRMPTPADAAERLEWLGRAAAKERGDATVVIDRAALEAMLRGLQLPAAGDAEWLRRRGELVERYLASDEVPPFDAATRTELARAAVEHPEGSPALAAAFAHAAPSPEEGGLAYNNLIGRLADERRHLAVERALPAVLAAAHLGDAAAALRTRAAALVDDLFLPPPAGAAEAPLVGHVAGEPILDRGFSRSVGDNQVRSLIVTLVVVMLLMLLLFRSLRLALLSMAASTLTLALIFGTMGMLGVHIDLGTSLVAGITTGAGSDFAMHYLWYLRRQSADEVSRSVGPVMVISIVLVALGFWVLALGRSPVMHLFGTLAGLSMFLSALFTCLLVPAVLNKVDA